MLLKCLKLIVMTDIFITALFIPSLINLLENDLFTSITLVFMGMIGLTINYNLKQFKEIYNK